MRVYAKNMRNEKGLRTEVQDQAASVGVLFMILERQSGILSKVLPRLIGVVHDLGGEGLEGGELPLLPQVLVKLHLDLLAV